MELRISNKESSRDEIMNYATDNMLSDISEIRLRGNQAEISFENKYEVYQTYAEIKSAANQTEQNYEINFQETQTEDTPEQISEESQTDSEARKECVACQTEDNIGYKSQAIQTDTSMKNKFEACQKENKSKESQTENRVRNYTQHKMFENQELINGQNSPERTNQEI